jgi:hypothetical protein
MQCLDLGPLYATVENLFVECFHSGIILRCRGCPMNAGNRTLLSLMCGGADPRGAGVGYAW